MVDAGNNGESRQPAGIRRVEDMPVYQLLYLLAEVERRSRDYPRDFVWLRGQKLRSSESVCANLTEGFYSQYSTEYLQCLFRCRREARETQTHMCYARDVGMLEKTIAVDLLGRYEDGLVQISQLIASGERKISNYGKSKPVTSVHEITEEYVVGDASNHQPFPSNH